jgi:hypothetical protein
MRKAGLNSYKASDVNREKQFQAKKKVIFVLIDKDSIDCWQPFQLDFCGNARTGPAPNHSWKRPLLIKKNLDMYIPVIYNHLLWMMFLAVL